MATVVTLLHYDFMRRALIAALLVGVAAPSIGTFLVARRQALMGDGIGHVALTGVALGFLLNTAPFVTAVLTAAAGALLIEWVRARGRASGDVALALLFYGGIAGGVLLIGLSPGGSNATLLSYLFGSLTSVSRGDLTAMAALTAAVLLVVAVLARLLFAVSYDEEFAAVRGVPTRWLGSLLAVMAAVTITVAMRVVGLLLVSALMVVPVATVQLVTHGFRQTLLAAAAVGAVTSVVGVVIAFYADVAPGACIVVTTIGVYALASALPPLRTRMAG
ncbi:MAG: zinc transport system permease protein [Frankiaceae bacterium]|nr:zinc transport system permease protein [Frankiaceae bacterium]